MKKARIQPTGDEIRSGVVLDTDSPMIAEKLAALGFQADIAEPLKDEEENLKNALLQACEAGFDLFVFIGGSGGGHRFDPTLGKDFTHTAMDAVLTECCGTSLYGKNGHLWSRLICGRLKRTLVFNVPGPYREAEAAVQAFCHAYPGGAENLKELNEAMAAAVAATYG